MEQEIVKAFPSILVARACSNQKEFGQAVDIYSEILESARKTHDEASLLMCHLYLEYATSLISLCFATNFDKLQRLANRQSVNIFENVNDLEIAWDLLEISRITFSEANDAANLKKTHFLLGEVLLNDNKIEEALVEYEKVGDDTETLYRKALCHEFLNNYEEAVDILKNIKSDDKELMKEIKEEIKFLKEKIKLTNEKLNEGGVQLELEKKIENVNDEEIKNIDFLIKKQ